MPLTTGIVSIGTDSRSAKLYRYIVEYCSKGKDVDGAGCTRDQDHPPTIAINLLPDNIEEVNQSFDLALHLGADFLVVPDRLPEARLLELSERSGRKIFVQKDGQSLKELAKEVANYALLNKKESKRNSLPAKSFPDFTIESDKKLIRFVQNVSQKKGRIIGALTGAGPIAGADYCESLAKNSLPYIMMSDTTAPDKNDAILGKGPDFKPDYYRDIKWLSRFSDCITIACNTAHANFDDFEKTASPKKILDIRDATVKFLQANFKSNKKVILLGTPATLRAELYNQKIIDAGYEIIQPDEGQMKIIYRSIYRVKGDLIKSEFGDFNMKDAKADIMLVVRQIRGTIEDVSGKVPVILGCTELNVPFSNSELVQNALISTSGSLAILARKFSQGQQNSDNKSRKLVTSDSGELFSSPDLSPVLNDRPPPAFSLEESSSFGKSSSSLKVPPSPYIRITAADKLGSGSKLDKKRSYQYNSEEPSDDENDCIGLINSLKNDTISIVKIPYRNKMHIKFTELNSTAVYSKIDGLKRKYESEDIRCHRTGGYISCDISNRDFEDLKKYFSSNLNIKFEVENKQGYSR